MDIQKLVRKNIRDLVPYSAARYEFDGSNATLLDANENPYGAPYNRYPDPWQRDLKENLADRKGISKDQIFIGNGADEAIDLLIRAFCEPGVDNILINDPTYSMYGVSANINGNHIIKVPLNRDFTLNKKTLLKAITHDTKLIFLCSPANPSGNLLDKNDMREIIGLFNGLVIIDEAYIDFANDDGFVPLLDTFQNIVILQTFSKAWALAGIRVGMAFGNPDIISVLNKIKPPYNVCGPAQELALEAIRNEVGFRVMAENILQQKKVLSHFLNDYSPCSVIYPSDANFILAKFTESDKIYKWLKERSLIVRNRSYQTHCENCLRITIGTEEEINQLINLLIQYEKEAAVHRS